MSIELNVTARVVGADVEDARKQLFNLFGVALFPPPAAEPATLSTGGADGGAAIFTETPALQVGDALKVVATGPANGAAEPPAPAKRNRRTKAQIEQDRKELADRQAAEVKTLQAVDDAGLLDDPSDFGMSAEHDADDEFDLLGEGSGAAPPRTLTQADMMAAGRAVMDAKGLPGLGAILQRHGFKKVAEIPEHAYAAVMADLEEAVGG